jgi:hypothetical protein
MYISPLSMPSDSRVWVYQSNRTLTPDEENKITQEAKEFVDSWTAHNQTLHASFEIRHHIFLIFMIDQKHAAASGCSIDKSLHFIQNAEKKYSLSLLDRMIFAYKDNDEIHLVNKKEFDSLISSGKISDDTIVFNNLVISKSELDNSWEMPLGKSWHKQIVAH